MSEREREEDIPGLVDIALESDDEEVVHAASRALVSLGKRAIPEVSRGLLHQDAEKRWTAAEILGDIGDALALPALRTAYARELDGTVRGIILQGYGNIKEPSLEADLVRAVKEDPDPWARGMAAGALARHAMAFLDVEELSVLNEVSRSDPDAETRQKALAAVDDTLSSIVVRQAALAIEKGQTLDGLSPLHTAAYKGDTAELERLLQSGADANAATSAGVTPLILAVAFEQPRCAAMLLKVGANPNLGPPANKSA